MKRIYVCITLLSSTIIAREIRSPLLRDDPGYRLMPLPLSPCKPWAIKAWAEPFSRIATSALCSSDCDGCQHNNCSLSTIIFGKSAFTGAQAFSPESVAQSKTVFNGDGTNRTLTCTPLLESSLLKPCLTFIDHGIMFALQAVRRVKDCWSVGARASVPYRSFNIKHPCCNPPFGGSSIAHLLSEQIETIDGVTVRSYVYRLDVLSGLPIGCTAPQNLFPLVDYYNTLHVNNDITISNENVTDNVTLPINARNPVTLIYQANGAKPTGPYAVPLAVAQSLPALPGNGQTTDQRTRFIDGTNYQPLGLDAQTESTLWVVPSVGTTNLVPAALVIRDNVDLLLQTIALSTEQMFEQCGDCFDPQTSKGIGDLQTEYFVRWQPHDMVYIEPLFGVRFPTGARIKKPQQLLLWPTGNNGHYEYRLGAHVGMQPCDYFMINMNSYYTWVAPRTEQVLAAFEDATVKNIGGPTVPADIHWNYYLGLIDATFIQPCTNSLLGLDIRYELYHKGRDHVQCKRFTAQDCLGKTAHLSSCVLEERTKVTSHKLLATLFFDTSGYHKENRSTQWSLFVGYSGIIGGNNIGKEHGPYGGFMIIY